MIMQTAIVTAGNGSSRIYISAKIAQLLGLRRKGTVEVSMSTFNTHATRFIKMHMVDFYIRKLDRNPLQIKEHSVDVISTNLYPKVHSLSQFSSVSQYQNMHLLQMMKK